MAERVSNGGEVAVSLTEEQRVRFETILASGPAPYEAGQVQGLVTQKEGLARLSAFLFLGSSAQLAPFVLKSPNPKDRIKAGEEMRLRSVYQYYIGENHRNRQPLRVPIPFDNQKTSQGDLWAVPRVLRRGDRPYHWLEFYKPENPSFELKPFNSCFLSPEAEKTKYAFGGWHGVEEMMLADYTMGENGLTFQDLLPIRLPDKGSTAIEKYVMRARAGGYFNLSLGNKLINYGDRLQVLPRQDKRERYMCLDIINATNGGNVVMTYRVFRDTHMVSSKGWLGLEKQLIVDYISGKQDYSFDELPPIYYDQIPGGGFLELGDISGQRVRFSLHGEYEKQDKGVVLIPKQDRHGLYRWLESYWFDPNTRQPTGEAINSARVVDGTLVQNGWLGPERQALFDFSKGSVVFDQLYTVPLAVGHSGTTCYLWADAGKPVVLQLPRTLGLQKGDELTLLPDEVTDENAYFVLKKDGVPLLRYKFSFVSRQFEIESNYSLNDEVKYDPEKDVFIDTSGESWAYKDILMRRYGIEIVTVNSLCELLTRSRKVVLKIIGGNSTRKMRLYSVTELEILPKFIETIERIYTERRQRGEFGEAIPVDGANRWLRETMEEQEDD